ncbi:TIGR04222 domain-containing membrane protein [Streptomyces sp. NPDC006678]|uniref:TIGR04222 domain-containing membrane protein n=1 Tax=Streptomyces sp. NPDC006678 TaxID=3157185 RepID=UPI0033D297DA
MLWVFLLLPAWAAAGISCGRLCLAAAEAAGTAEAAAATEAGHDDAAPGRERGHARELSLYEAAFLAGGPYRVVTLTLVSMHRTRRLLLAHTGWATVVDPEGADELERSVIGAIGPEGQSRIAAVRHTTAAADAVRAVSDRLVTAGLAVPEAVRASVTGAVRAVRRAAAFTVALAAVALLMLPHEPGAKGTVAAWFVLPLVLTLGCLVIARVEVSPYTRWASPDGLRLLRSLSPGHGGEVPPGDRGEVPPGHGGEVPPGGGPLRGERAFLTEVAVHGTGALDDPALRAALGDNRTAQKGH